MIDLIESLPQEGERDIYIINTYSGPDIVRHLHRFFLHNNPF